MILEEDVERFKEICENLSDLLVKIRGYNPKATIYLNGGRGADLFLFDTSAKKRNEGSPYRSMNIGNFEEKHCKATATIDGSEKGLFFECNDNR